MHSKKVYYIAAFVGSIVGGYLPALWGSGFLSFSSLIFSSVGAVLGIIIAYKYLN